MEGYLPSLFGGCNPLRHIFFARFLFAVARVCGLELERQSPAFGTTGLAADARLAQRRKVQVMALCQRSTDHGQTFSLINRPDRLSLAGVTALDNGNLILVGQGGVHLAASTGADLGQQ